MWTFILVWLWLAIGSYAGYVWLPKRWGDPPRWWFKPFLALAGPIVFAFVFVVEMDNE